MTILETVGPESLDVVGLGLDNRLNPNTIGQSDIDPITLAFSGAERLANVLGEIRSPLQLLTAMGRYIQFNSIFAAGVAALAGHIASQGALFRDPDDPGELFSDRSSEVAAFIFSAAIDEFGDRVGGQRTGHRSLAQASLKGIGSFFGYSATVLSESIVLNDATRRAIRKVGGGYGIGRYVKPEALFRGIGFHLGSEFLAGEEFSVLNDFLRKSYPDLLEFLSKTCSVIAGVRCPSHLWLTIHAEIETEHYQMALVAANLAIRYAGAVEEGQHSREWILDGFGGFARLQAEFIDRLLD